LILSISITRFAGRQTHTVWFAGGAQENETHTFSSSTVKTTLSTSCSRNDNTWQWYNANKASPIVNGNASYTYTSVGVNTGARYVWAQPIYGVELVTGSADIERS
jgi:hypothetical protein